MRVTVRGKGDVEYRVDGNDEGDGEDGGLGCQGWRR